MAAQTLTQTQQSSSFAALPGAWKLCAGRAMTLRPRQDAILRVKQGRVWVTLASEPGDHVLVPGSTMRIPAGEDVVIEPWPLQDRQPVFFDWDPTPVYLTAVEPSVTLLPVVDAGLVGQKLLVRQAFRDLRSALGTAAGAAVRLTLGMARVVVGMVVHPRFGALA